MMNHMIGDAGGGGPSVGKTGDKKSRILSSLSYKDNETKKRVIVVLEHCPLEVAKVGGEYRLLNVDEHIHFLRKYNQKPDNYRPDIVHQCLMTLLDSPLNKANQLQIYLHTEKNVLIQVNPQTRIPRTYKRFAGLMIQLLQHFKIRAADENAVLMKVIKNPITDHLPSSARKILMTCHTNKLVHLRDFIPTVIKSSNPSTSSSKTGQSPEILESPIVFIVGGYAHGELSVDYADEKVSISQYALSASVVCSKICNAFEEHWGIL